MPTVSGSARAIANRLQDRWLRISTTGLIPTQVEGHIRYGTVDYPGTRTVLQKLRLGPDDVFVDIGCGKGRVVCLAARGRIREAVGVEYSENLADIAERNAGRLRGRQSPISIFCQAAETLNYTGATALYFFNPFEAPILDEVLSKIRTDTGGNSLRMAFVMESDAQRAVFARHDWLACYERWQDNSGHPVAFYRTARAN